MKLKISLLLICCLCLVSLKSQELLPLSSNTIKTLDSIALQDVPEGGPGIATCIIRDGQVIYQKVGGYANLADSSLIDENTRFNLASNGKQFTALAILRLIDAKKLALNDDIRKYLPELYPNVKSKISVEHLLTHTSGIRDVYDLMSLQGITWWKQTLSNKDILAMIKDQQEMNFIPGSAYLYSNSNYILLAEIIGKIQQSPYYLDSREMFAGMEMSHTSFEADHTAIPGPVANPYFNFDKWTNYNWIWNAYGDGNLFSTLADQVAWEKSIQTKQNALLSASIISRSQQPIGNSPAKYGYGLEFGNYRGQPCTFHEGATGAWKATVLRFPKQNLSLLTFTNSGKAIPAMQTRQMADVIFGWQNQKENYPISPLKSGPFVSDDEIRGIYQTKTGFFFHLEKRDTAIFLVRSGRNDTRLVRESANIFQQWNDSTFKQEFMKNAEGEMELTAYHTTHAPYTLIRPVENWDGFNFSSLNGIYENMETKVSLAFRYISGNEYEVEIGGKKNKGLLLTRNRLLVNNYALEISTVNGRNVSLLMLNGDRIRNVRFIRRK